MAHSRVVSHSHIVYVKSCKIYGIRSHKKRLELDRTNDEPMDIQVHHVQISSISKSEIKPFAVLGDLIQFKEMRSRETGPNQRRT